MVVNSHASVTMSDPKKGLGRWGDSYAGKEIADENLCTEANAITPENDDGDMSKTSWICNGATCKKHTHTHQQPSISISYDKNK